MSDLTSRVEYKFLPALKWSALNSFYDLVIGISGLGNKFTHGIINTVHINDDHTVLDVGCGSGELALALKQHYPSIEMIGIEPDAHMLSSAKKKLLKNNYEVNLLQARAEKLPLADASIDICFCTLTLHHLPSSVKQTAIAEIFRALKPGGTFVLTDWGVLRRKFLQHFLLFERKDYMKDHIEGMIPHYLEAAGFQIKSHKLVKPMGIFTTVMVKPAAVTETVR